MTRIFRPVFCLWTVLLLTACSTSNPKAGATFAGKIAIDTKHAESATLYFGVTESGKTIEYVRMVLTGVNCAAMSAERSDYYHIQNVPITDGRFQIEDDGIGIIDGRFTSPTEASGTIQIRYMPNEGGAVTNFTVHGWDIPCDLGTWRWKAVGK